MQNGIQQVCFQLFPLTLKVNFMKSLSVQNVLDLKKGLKCKAHTNDGKLLFSNGVLSIERKEVIIPTFRYVLLLKRNHDFLIVRI